MPMATVCKTNIVTVADKVGRLAELTGKIKDAGINILALVGWADAQTGHMHIVSEDAEKLCGVLCDEVDSCSYGEIVCVKLPDRPGALNEAATKLAEAGIGIEMVFATACDAPEAAIVMATTDNAKAAEIL